MRPIAEFSFNWDSDCPGGQKKMSSSIVVWGQELNLTDMCNEAAFGLQGWSAVWLFMTWWAGSLGVDYLMYDMGDWRPAGMLCM